ELVNTTKNNQHPESESFAPNPHHHPLATSCYRLNHPPYSIPSLFHRLYAFFARHLDKSALVVRLPIRGPVSLSRSPAPKPQQRSTHHTASPWPRQPAQS